ncbi:MAG: methyltransferase domain-containing protein [Chitinophagaceae bacterium]|nr:methyltransferase domain-containing protein [Chitinophagaceae bacterium]
MPTYKTASDPPADRDFWDQRWRANETGWDLGYVSPAIEAYLSQYPDKHAAILIPGCGNAYEAAYLIKQGFTNITLIDIAPAAVEKLQHNFEDTTGVEIVCGNFFEHAGQYDLIIEQTFFCAIPPQSRPEYAAKVAALLRPGGKLAGVLFDTTFERQGPPFGGSASEYRAEFEPYFTIKTMAPCMNSIAPRAGTELFINLIKK